MKKISITAIGIFSPNIGFLTRIIKRIFCPKKVEKNRKHPCSCYIVRIGDKYLILDLGAGTLKGAIKFLKEKDVSIEDVIIVLSHNHVDHSFDMIELCYRMFFKGIKNKWQLIKQGRKSEYEKIRIPVYLPKKSLMYWFISFFSMFEHYVINNNTHFRIEDCNIDFCRTDHRGESYATRIKQGNNAFVYTSDIFSVTKNVYKFVKNVKCSLIDSGHPRKCERFTLNRYHGRTQKIIYSLNKSGVKKIYLSHLKRNLNSEEYLKVIPDNIIGTVEIMELLKEKEIF